MTLSEESRVVASWRSSPRKGQTLADNESVSVAEPELIGACLFLFEGGFGPDPTKLKTTVKMLQT